MRKMRAGSIWDSIKNGWNSASQTASNSWNSLTGSTPNEKKSTNDYYSSSTNNPTSYSSPSTTSTSLSPSTSSSTYTQEPYNMQEYTKFGGKRNRNRKRHGGGFMESSLAAQAAPFSGSQTAQARWVGGAKRTRKMKKTRKNKRSSRKH
jgi:hypothetical protein